MFTFKNFNIADWFSFYRIFAAPILLLLIYLDQRLIFTWLLLISYSTDAIDGFLARKLKITSPRGSQLDSIGDQITLIIGLLGLFYFETNFIKPIFWIRNKQLFVGSNGKSDLMEKLGNMDIEVLATVGAGDIDTFVEPIRNMLKKKYEV